MLDFSKIVLGARLKLIITWPDQPHLPQMEIEDTPEACALFVARLGQAKSGARPLVQMRGKATKHTRGAPKTGVTKRSQDSSVRTYGGKPNRRHMVLETFRALAAAGNTTPHMEEIRAQYAAKYPEEPLQGLDQVVRDMVNKTNLVERLAAGTFQLRGNDRVGNGLNVLDDAF